MRQLLLTLIVLALSATGLAEPFIGLCGYIWFSLMRPDVLAWIEERSWFSMALAISTLLGGLRHVGLWPYQVLQNPLIWPVFALQAPILGSVLLAQIPELSMPYYNQYVRMLIVLLMIPILVTGKREIRILCAVMAVSVALLGAKMGIYGLVAGGVHFAQGHGGMMSDNNTLALALAMSIPLCWYGRTFYKNTIWKLSALGLFFGTIACVVMTRSRGAAVATAVCMLMIVLRSKRKVLTLVALVLMSLPGIYLTWDRFAERMATVKDPVAEASANSRIIYAGAALRLAADYPLFGVGFGMENEQRVITRYLPNDYLLRSLVIHNTYLQMLTDSGIPALAVYAVMLGGTVWWLGRSARRLKRLRPGQGLENIPYALQGAMVVFMVGSTFLSRTFFDFVYMIIFTAAAWYRIEQRELSEQPVVDTPAGEEQPEAAPAVEPVPVAAGAPPPPRQSRLARERALWKSGGE
jgi:probable O-glycosylation ligase (exosortase A-associated)